jgi:hypothetical protein
MVHAGLSFPWMRCFVFLEVLDQNNNFVFVQKISQE